MLKSLKRNLKPSSLNYIADRSIYLKSAVTLVSLDSDLKINETAHKVRNAKQNSTKNIVFRHP